MSYYDSDAGFKYYTAIHGSPDYSGIALYEVTGTEKDTVDGSEYPRGVGRTFVEALKLRDERVLKYLLENMPKDRKVKVLELGSGRGGLTRYIAKNLHD